MSGIDIQNEDSMLATLEAVLDRRTPIKSLDALTRAINKTPKTVAIDEIAFGIDTNVFLRLAKHPKSDDMVDFLLQREKLPVILPGQAVQEFWRNQLSGIETVAAKTKKKYEELKAALREIDESYGNSSNELQRALDQFEDDYGHYYDKQTTHRVGQLLEFLIKRATLSYVPRSRFLDIAVSRKRSKTPPGFKDPSDQDGDFYIWTEFLAGLMRAKQAGSLFTHAVLLINDVKADWSTNGVAHPILVAEVQELLGVSFESWTIEKFSQVVEDSLKSNTQPLKN